MHTPNMIHYKPNTPMDITTHTQLLASIRNGRRPRFRKVVSVYVPVSRFADYAEYDGSLTWDVEGEISLVSANLIITDRALLQRFPLAHAFTAFRQ
jgi:hypothetical protein